jgi:nitrogen fixation protein NifQ
MLAISSVIRAGNSGDLPLFAATLGLPQREFSAPLDEPSQLRVQISRIHCELLDDWLPDLFPLLVKMLWDHRSSDRRINQRLTLALAAACFGRQHLWQDLGLRGRADVSALVSQWFPTLFALNTQDLKWKRFFFQELGKRLGEPDLRPPGCDGCDNEQSCFPASKNGSHERQIERDDRRARMSAT